MTKKNHALQMKTHWAKVQEFKLQEREEEAKKLLQKQQIVNSLKVKRHTNIHEKMLEEFFSPKNNPPNIVEHAEKIFACLKGSKILTHLEDNFKGKDVFARRQDSTIKDSIKNIVNFHSFWLRPLEDFHFRSHNIYKQLGELARHLFCEYPMPYFMDSCLSQSSQIEWFIDYGTGASPKNWFNFTPLLTKKMLHTMMTATNVTSIEEAVRYAQINCLGGDRKLLAATFPKLKDFHDSENEAFYLEFIQWLINQGMFDYSTIDEMYDFIIRAKFQPAQVDLEIPVGSYALKGRTVDSVLRATKIWHHTLNTEKATKNDLRLSWTGFQNLKNEFIVCEEGSETHYFFRELLTSGELREEGSAMHHCVASYVTSCSSGRTHIFSMTRYRKRVLTVEVNSGRNIVQKRGICNACPTPVQEKLVKAWASANGFKN